jgi:hypothetical protein
MAFDSNFELKFSQLVDTRLQEKVPALYPNRVGFQLIDVNDTQDKGVGVMAFIVDGQWLYAPAFFLKGQLKGLELLYVKNKDMFVPLKDSWISFIQKGQMRLLGHGVDKKDVTPTKPDMIDLVLSPHEKISNEKDALIDKETLGMMMTKFAELDCDLVTNIPKLGKEAFEQFVGAMKDDPDFANAIFNFYKPADLRKMAELVDLNPKSIDGSADKKINPDNPESEDTGDGTEINETVSKAIADSKETVDVKKEEEIMEETEEEKIPARSTLVEEKTAGENERGKRDGTGPYKHSLQRLLSKMKEGKMQEMGKACPAKEDAEKTAAASTDIPEDLESDTTKGSDTVEELVVVTNPNEPEASTLSDNEKEILLRDGIFVKDTRKNTSAVFNTEVNTCNFNNPTSTGLYEVLLADGTACPMLIIFPNKEVKTRTYSSDSDFGYKCRHTTGPDNDVCLINPADPTKYYTKPAREVLAKPAGRLPEELYNKMKNLKEFTKQRYAEGDSKRMLVVDKKHNAIILRAPWGREKMVTSRDTLPTFCCGDGSIRFTGKDGKISVTKNMVYIPDGAAYFEYEYDCPHQLGDVNTFIYHMRKTAGLQRLKIYSDNNGYALTTDTGQTYNLNKKAALINLVKEHGIQASLAKKMIKEASFKGVPVSKRYFVKYADMYDLSPGDPREMAGSYDEAPLENTYENPVAEGLQVATDASNKGVKEVMDTTVLASLAGTSHSMELMGTYISDLIRAMDRVGRMLFLFYWHTDEFEDQYGAQEQVELEESLRELFDSVGDLVLFLKEKSVDFDSLFSGNREDMADDLGTVD